ncbi:MAG: SRPBCC family protein [Bacillota bacterium]
MQPSQSRSQASLHKGSTPQSKLLQIERKFNVPVDQLFNAFTTSESLKKWWWPQGLYADKVEVDFHEGGRYFINMKGNPDLGGGGMTGQFEEIETNKRIVMTDNFANEQGQKISSKEANMPGEWPKQGFITFEFESLDHNTSRFMLYQEGIPNELQDDCIKGWTESFDKLEKFLEILKH